jgi:signal transduction histidine kinase
MDRKSINDYAKIIACITQSNGVTIMEYVVGSGIFIRWNGDAETMNRSFSLEQYFTYIHPDDVSIAQELVDVLNKGERTYYTCEYRYMFPDAKEYSWQYNDIFAYKIDENNHVKSYIGVCRRNNKWHKAMDEMVLLRDKAEESNRLKTKFIEDMSHEIRTPLNAVIGFSQLLCSDHFENKQKEEIKGIITENSNVLIQTFDDILDLAKMEEGVLTINYESTELMPFLKNIVSGFLIKEKGNLKLHLLEGEKIVIKVDRHYLATIINNLLSNAIKFTKDGSVSIGYHVKDDEVEFFVSDTGIGISEEAIAKIFGRFEKADDFSAGTGLGLAICKELAVAMGGSIRVESEQGKGSTFYVLLPVNK